MNGNTIRIKFVNQDGGGFAPELDIPTGMTVVQFFSQRYPGKSSTDYKIRVNGLLAGIDDVLKHGDRVSVTPKQLKGAA